MKICNNGDFRYISGKFFSGNRAPSHFGHSHFASLTEPDFRKNSFSSRKCRYMPEKPYFWYFLEISSLVFPNFFAQRCVLIMPKIWLSLIFEKIFFRLKIPGICWKLPFLQIFIGLFPLTSFFSRTLMIALFCLFVRSFVRSLARLLPPFVFSLGIFSKINSLF